MKRIELRQPSIFPKIKITTPGFLLRVVTLLLIQITELFGSGFCCLGCRCFSAFCYNLEGNLNGDFLVEANGSGVVTNFLSGS